MKITDYSSTVGVKFEHIGSLFRRSVFLSQIIVFFALPGQHAYGDKGTRFGMGNSFLVQCVAL